MTATIKRENKKGEKQGKEITTIKLSRRTKAHLDALKTHPKESYEEVLRKTFGILALTKVNPIRARMKVLEVESQNKRIRK